MDFAGYMIWPFICFMASVAVFIFVAVIRFVRWPPFLGYVAAAVLIYTTPFAFDGVHDIWFARHSSWRAEHHIFTSDDSSERFLRFRYPAVALAVLSALALLNFGPQRHRDDEEPPTT